MTDAERQARHRAARAAALPAIRYRRAADHRGRARRWRDAVTELIALQAEYQAWLEALPDNLREGTTAQALQAICEFDLGELQAIEPPRGFGRVSQEPVDQPRLRRMAERLHHCDILETRNDSWRFKNRN